MRGDDVPGAISTFVLGIAVGAVVSLLFAPKPGEELRVDLAGVLSEAADQVNSTGKGLKRRGEVLVNLGKSQVQDAIEAGDDAYKRAKSS